MFSPLQNARLQFKPVLPNVLTNLLELQVVQEFHKLTPVSKDIAHFFPNLDQLPLLRVQKREIKEHRPLKVGVVLSGGQAPGGHNVISGLYDALKILNNKSTLIGFLNGPSGIINDESLNITEELLSNYRNQGGFDIIGSGRTKIETKEQFKKTLDTVNKQGLDGLVIIGGDDSNTNAAFLAEYFLQNGSKTSVVGVPKTIDGDLKSIWTEVSFGFDTASKVYSSTIGSLMRDALSAKKYYYFIKLMGRSASHLTLECALQTHPNLTLISEEIENQNITLSELVDHIVDLVCKRSEENKDYGVILIPEGVIEFIPEVKALINELNSALSPQQKHSAFLDKLESDDKKITYVLSILSDESKSCFLQLPDDIKAQLLLGRDGHGNVQVSKIETERMLMNMVKMALAKKKQEGKYNGKFEPQPHFCGYEGRSCLPSNFDSNYCYALGHTAALLVDAKATGYLCFVANLAQDTKEWLVGGIPIVNLMAIEKRHGELKPVVNKALVDLKGQPFLYLKKMYSEWAIKDDYLDPGPIQYFGDSTISDAITKTLTLETKVYLT